MYALLSNDWSGLLIALVILSVGVGGWRLGRRARSQSLRRLTLAVGGLIAIIGLVLSVTSSIHGIRVARMWSAHPAPGVMVDVGGYEMHLVAEGENRGNATVVVIPGGHSAGYQFYNLHQRLRADTRSILFDRLATGWSDVGPFPRTSAREAEEFQTLLQNAGETGPFVLVGHSYGGLLAVVHAMRYPRDIAGLVLLDPGLAELYQNPVAAGFLNQTARSTFKQALLQTFGIPYDIHSREYRAAVDKVMDVYKRELADVWADIEQLGLATMNGYGAASIFTEINDASFFQSGLIRSGALNGVPVASVTYLGGADLDSQGAVDFVLGIRPDLDAEGARGQIDGLRATRARILSLSDNIQTYSVPPGASHNFPYETPDFVMELVRDMLRRVRDPAAPPILGAALPHGYAADTITMRASPPHPVP